MLPAIDEQRCDSCVQASVSSPTAFSSAVESLIYKERDWMKEKIYRIYLRINQSAYKLTPVPTAKVQLKLVTYI